jgi:DNA-binding MarR family transcriptional regulator
VTKLLPAPSSSSVGQRRGSIEPWLKRWHVERADIDRTNVAILGRIFRLGPAFESFRARALSSMGSTPEISDLIISLLRSGPPYELNAGALSLEATFPLSTTGGMTYRIDSAEKLGLVERRRDSKDRRSVIVGLTEMGLALANQDVDVHMKLVAQFLHDFTDNERRSLANLLQKLLIGLGA